MIMVFEDHLLTEAVNTRSAAIDTLNAAEIVALMNDEDGRALQAVRDVSEAVAAAMQRAADGFRRGGRILYIGAGTSGRLGVLDASECPPTFSTPPEMVVGIIAGGSTALTRAVEGAEDSPEQGAIDLLALKPTSADMVVGIATSGRTPYVLGAMKAARAEGAFTVGLACNRPSLLGEVVDLEIAPLVGPEVIAGSTRLKSGTATKLILNMITTGAMVLIGKTYGNRMVDLMPTNHKLRLRTRRILRELAEISDELAGELLEHSAGRLKPALVAAMAGIDIRQAQSLLDANAGQVRLAVAAAIKPDRSIP
jgi:N-acetylmuramic acid 6-phosphate etherase